ncbi:helix-turn-helix domain-containing protein, partial [Acinetobacter baumannii]
SYLGRIERGGNPTLEKIYELAALLELDAKDLLPK